MRALLRQIAERNNLTLLQVKPLLGGDINDVYLLECSDKTVVVKLNAAEIFPEMFETEAKGLQLLASTNSFRIPKVLEVGSLNESTYLMLEYVKPSTPSNSFWEHFGEQLAKLHQTSATNFGLPYPNYIGSLRQYNAEKDTAGEFFITQRLQPQFELAAKNGFEFQNLSNFYRTVLNEIPDEPPALVHGDLWNGNYLVSENSEAVLIDPAAAYAPREMDLAMMQLFGGFPNDVFSIYQEIFPIQKGWEKRISIFQLYYLLVHLNLFGGGYLPQVKSIIRAFS